MSHPNGGKSGALSKLIATAFIGIILHFIWPQVSTGRAPEWLVYTFAGGAILTVIGTVSVILHCAATIQKMLRAFRARRPKLSDSATHWLTKTEARKAGLTKTEGFLLGILEGMPIFIANAVHGLICAPARKGKTTSFVMLALLMAIWASKIIADMKGELGLQTGTYLQRQGQECIYVNPDGKFGLPNWAYNPMQIIIDNFAFSPQDTVADTLELVHQIYPIPDGGERDSYWPEGTRQLLAFTILALVTLRGEAEANIPRTYETLCRAKELESLLVEAKSSDVLAGELSGLADTILANREVNEKHFDSFRQAAAQRLVAFGPSGRLAPSMTHCDFRFRDLKIRNITVFLICDYSRMDVYALWLRLLLWAALKELIRENNIIPVHFILDEFTNYKLPGLPNALTALGGYGVHCWMIVQELSEIARVYGQEALKTILSQTDVKQFFGVASVETATMISRMLGEREHRAQSFGLGQDFSDGTNLNLSAGTKPLMTADQIRRLPEDEQIIFVRNLPPIRALKVGYQEIEPWRSEVAPNPLHGGKRFIGKLRLKIINGRFRATRHGRRKVPKEKRPLLIPILASLAVLRPGAGAILITAAITTPIISGWPSLRVQYSITSSGNYRWCEYYGLPDVTKPQIRNGAEGCPIVIWSKSGGSR